MRGYKGMTRDMTCRGMKFEIGKTYHVDGNIILCKNGLHFCKNLIDVMFFYNNDGHNRYFEVEADGIIKTDGRKSVASSLTVIRELKGMEINRTLYGNSYEYDYGNIYDNGDGYGDGYGYGDGCGYGDGYSYGYGDGCGDGFGDGFGYVAGYGNGNGYGNYSINGFIKYI